MKRNFLRGGEFYDAPDVEILDVKIEGGFNLSDTDVERADIDDYGEF